MIHLRTLGAIELDGSARQEARQVISQQRRLAVLLYLALARPRGYHRRDTIIGMFWPEADTDRARNSLRQTLHQLRNSLGEELLPNRGHEEIGIAPRQLWCDALAFEEAVQAGSFEESLELYRGDLLPGFFLTDAPEFERWLEEERDRLRRLAADAAWALADRCSATGAASEAGRWARRAVNLMQGDEAAGRRRIALLDRLGDRAGALRAYEELAAQLRNGYEIAPSRETETLVAGIRARAAAEPDRPAVASTVPAAPTSPAATVPTDPPGRRSPWARLAFASGGGLLIVGAFMATRWVRERGLHPGEAPLAAIAVLPFTVQGPDEVRYLGEGMVSLLGDRLSFPGRFQVADTRASIGAAGTDSEGSHAAGRGSRVAAKLGTRMFVEGDIVASGDALHLTAELHDREHGDSAVARATAVGSASRIFELVDTLAVELLSQGFNRRADGLPHASPPTASVDALKHFLVGSELLRRGDYFEASRSFRLAIAADSNFTLAFHRLAVASDWLGGNQEAMWASQEAVNRAKRRPADENHLILAFYFYLRGDGVRIESECRAMLAVFPDAVEAWETLGEGQFHYGMQSGRPYTYAREAFERVLGYEPENFGALLHLARIAATEGRRQDVVSLTDRMLALRPSTTRANEVRALRAFAVNDHAAIEAVRREAEHAGDYALEATVQSASVYARNLPAAVELIRGFRAPFRAREWQARGLATLSHLQMARGRRRDAWTALDTLAQLDPQHALLLRATYAGLPWLPLEPAGLQNALDQIGRWSPTAGALYPPLHEFPIAAWNPVRRFLAGRIALRLGDHALARHYADSLALASGQAMADSVSAELQTLLRVTIMRAEGHPAEALAELDRMSEQDGSWLNRMLYDELAFARYLRSELLVEVGRDQEALDGFRAFPETSGLDLMYVAPSYLAQARILKARGDSAGAAVLESRAAELWRDADPELGAASRRAPR